MKKRLFCTDHTCLVSVAYFRWYRKLLNREHAALACSPRNIKGKFFSHLKKEKHKATLFSYVNEVKLLDLSKT